MGVLQRTVARLGPGAMARVLHRPALKTQWREWRPRSGAAREVYAHVHRPEAPGVYPAVVLVPGALSPGTVFDGFAELSAADVAALGFVVVHYDPSGRGRSGGTEDYWGRRHQRELVNVLQSLAERDDVENGCIGIASFSIGVAIAAGALTHTDVPPVAFLFDWEGPSNRFNITRNDRHPPLKAFPTSNTGFWREREPVRHLPAIACGYSRYQAHRDHMQGSCKGHAVEMVNTALDGDAAWVRLNGRPVWQSLDETGSDLDLWVPWHRNHKGTLLRYVLDAAGRGIHSHV